MSTLGLPLLVVVEGENDVCFLKGMSQVLHQADPAVPDLRLNSRTTRELRSYPQVAATSLNGYVPIGCLHKTKKAQDPRTRKLSTNHRIPGSINFRSAAAGGLVAATTRSWR